MKCRGPGQQIKRLEDKANFLIAYARKLIVVHFGDVLAVEPVFTTARSIEAANQIH